MSTETVNIKALRNRIAQLEAENIVMLEALVVAYDKLRTIPWVGGSTGPTWLTLPREVLFERTTHTNALAQRIEALEAVAKQARESERVFEAIAGDLLYKEIDTNDTVGMVERARKALLEKIKLLEQANKECGECIQCQSRYRIREILEVKE